MAEEGENKLVSAGQEGLQDFGAERGGQLVLVHGAPVRSSVGTKRV